ncbi:unnamed protein product, partial [Meganyctiphanes norvegica]
MSFFHDVGDYFDDLFSSLRHDNNERLREERVEEEVIRVADETENEVEVKPKVVSVNLQAKTNALNSHCEKFELVNRKKATSVIRRGGPMSFDITFNQDADLKDGLKVTLYFSFGPRPSSTKGTQAILLVTGKNTFDKNEDEWDVRFSTQDGETATIEVQIPHHVPVGVWKLAVEVSPRGDDKVRDIFRLEDQIFILFNPWSKG